VGREPDGRREEVRMMMRRGGESHEVERGKEG
jgi:hypothetical protein